MVAMVSAFLVITLNESQLFDMKRARAAMAIGNLPLAIADLMTFGDEVGHCVIGNVHTGAPLGQLMAQVGRTAEGIDTMSDLIANDEHISMRIVRSQMQLQQGHLDVAEKEQKLLKELPKANLLFVNSQRFDLNKTIVSLRRISSKQDSIAAVKLDLALHNVQTSICTTLG